MAELAVQSHGLTPMETEFYGPSNKYDYLPDEKMQPYFQHLNPADDGIITKRFKLHITNIPTSLNHHGLRNIFQKFGSVVDTYIHTPPGLSSEAKRWGFVYYGSHLAAQQAINHLDRAEPLKLNVRYALSENQLANLKAERESAMVSAGQHNDQIQAFIQQCHRSNANGPKNYSTAGRGGQLSKLAQEHRLPYQPSHLLEPEAKFAQESFSSAVDEQEEEALVRNRAPRFVVRPEIDPATLRSKLFGHPHVLPKAPSKVCEFCGQSGRVRCSRCRSWYCGQKCQLEDWPVHKLDTVVPGKIKNPKKPQPPAPLRHMSNPDVGNALSNVREEAAETLPSKLKPSDYEHVKDLPSMSVQQLEKPSNPYDALHQAIAKPSEEITQEMKNLKIAELAQKDKPEMTLSQTPESQPMVIKQPEAVKNTKVNVQDKEKANGSQNEIIQVKSPEPEKNVVHPQSVMPPRKVRIPENPVMKDPEVKFISPQPNENKAPKAKPGVSEKPTEVKKWKESIVKNMISQKGTTQNFFVFTNSESEEINLDSFGVMLIVDEYIEFILEEIVQEILGQNQLKEVKPGDLVIVTAPGQEEEFAYRGLVLATKDNVANVLLIDYGVTNKYEISGLFASTPKVTSFPALGFRFVPTEPLTSEMKALIRAQLVAEANICLGQIGDLISTSDQEIDHVNIVLMSGEERLAGFEAHPAYQIDERAERLQGWEKTMPTLTTLGVKSIGDNAKVMMTSYDETTDIVVVQEVKDVLSECHAQIDALLEKELRKFKVPIFEPRKGCLVACKWSEDDRLYRAIILSIDPSRKKVKVRFIDYGNTAIEGYGKLAKLPSILLDPKYPPVAHLVKLDGVPSLDLNTPTVTVGLKHIAPQLEVPLTLQLVGKSDGEVPVVKLVHPSKLTFNEMLTAKLKEGDSVQFPKHGRDCKVVGGNFDYDSCHIAALPATLNEVQSVFVLHVESPFKIFVCPAAQIGLYEKVDDKINEYCQELALTYSHLPRCNHVCLAKASDEAWYRAVCLQDLGDDLFNMFFPDLGYTEQIPSSRMTGIIDVLMEIPFLANHCTLFDLEGKDVSDKGIEKVLEVLSELLPPFTEVQVLLKDKTESVFHIQIPEHQARIDAVIKEAIEGKPTEKANPSSEAEQAERDRLIADLEAQLAKLKG
eukprot:TCALIF_06335-PA protein Name:"Similar to TDRD1 Tudor domain-containing protein 1 (Homo sapiens)" AED:0.01 eAED:0.01 QI:165/0.7/0.72/0.90/0.8/0.90/11/100/1155